MVHLLLLLATVPFTATAGGPTTLVTDTVFRIGAGWFVDETVKFNFSVCPVFFFWFLKSIIWVCTSDVYRHTHTCVSQGDTCHGAHRGSMDFGDVGMKGRRHSCFYRPGRNFSFFLSLLTNKCSRWMRIEPQVLHMRRRQTERVSE